MQESVVYQQLIREGKEEGIQEGIKRVALNLLAMGVNLEQVATGTGLSFAQLQELQDSLAESDRATNE